MPLPGCDPNSIALGSIGATEVMAKKSVDLLVSSRCAEEAREIGRMAFFARMPVMNRCGYSVETYDRQLYPTLVQTVDLPVATMALALGRLMASLGQREVCFLVLYSDISKIPCPSWYSSGPSLQARRGLRWYTPWPSSSAPTTTMQGTTPHQMDLQPHSRST